MTIICSDGITIAADGLVVTDDAVRIDLKRKKIVVEDHVIYALAGTSAAMPLLIKWVKEGADQEKLPKLGDNAWGLVVIDHDGPRHYSNKFPFAERWDYPFTTGSGRDFALGALQAGATPEEAVRVTCNINIFCGGEIQVVNIAEALGLQKVMEAAE